MHKVFSYCQSNVSADLRKSQKAVFDHLRIDLAQDVNDDLSHAEWLYRTISNHSDSEVVLISDIDAFPLKHDAVEQFSNAAESGGIAGLAQVANHKDPSRIYAGPMFLALTAGTFRALGSPNLERWKHGDVGQVLTDRANERGIKVTMIEPKFAVLPKWNFADRGVFGTGTFYGNLEFFHLFESRKPENEELFKAVSRGTISGRHDFSSYIKLVSERPPSEPSRKKRFRFSLFGGK